MGGRLRSRSLLLGAAEQLQLLGRGQLLHCAGNGTTAGPDRARTDHGSAAAPGPHPAQPGTARNARGPLYGERSGRSGCSGHRRGTGRDALSRQVSGQKTREPPTPARRLLVHRLRPCGYEMRRVGSRVRRRAKLDPGHCDRSRHHRERGGCGGGDSSRTPASPSGATDALRTRLRDKEREDRHVTRISRLTGREGRLGLRGRPTGWRHDIGTSVKYVAAQASPSPAIGSRRMSAIMGPALALTRAGGGGAAPLAPDPSAHDRG